MNKNKVILILLSSIISFFLVSEHAIARRMGGFSGGRSFSSMSSRSFSSRSYSSSRNWGATRRSVNSSTITNRNVLSGTRASTVRNNTNSISQAQYQRARANGTTFQNRTQAQKAFINRNASQYPSRYSTQPSTRPQHIPQSTQISGRTVDVTYNNGLGGYGYIHPTLGRWMLYSAMTDSIMLGTLMSRQNYYYGTSPDAYYSGRSSGFWSGLMTIAIILAIFFVIRAGSRSD